MSKLSKLKTDDKIQGETDNIGGSIYESGLYPATITLAYEGESSGGALSLNVHLEGEQGQTIRSTIYVTSGTAKGQKNTYTNKKGEEQYLPGFLSAQSLSMMAVGKPLSELVSEEKTIDVYNYEAKAEVPTKVPMLTELIGKKVIVGLIKQTVDKRAKGDDGKYHATGETRDENEIDKFFHYDSRMTTSEIAAKAEVAKFIDTWDKKNTGVTRDRTTKVTGTAGKPGTKAPASSTKPTESLFGNSETK